MFHQKAADLLLGRLQRLEHGHLHLELADGSSHHFAGGKPGPKAHMKLHDNSAISNMLWRGDIGLAEDYRRGKWDSADIAALVELGIRNERQLGHCAQGSAWSALLQRLAYALAANTKRGSRRNIHAHYDLGNSFYQLWLDPGMTYSSGLFNDAGDSLGDAQRNKNDRILERIGGQSQDVLEIGCGWGSFAERAALLGDHRVNGITISAAQHQYATDRLRQLHQADVRLQDYRDAFGQYDAIVSIEMFEAVGERYWQGYFAKIKSLLKRNAKAVIQTITIGDHIFDRYRRGSDFLRSYIFPGGMLPSRGRFTQEAERAGLRVADQHTFGPDYARTLGCWLDNFEARLDDVRAQGFDEPFIRLWRFYLACCIGAFNAGRTDVMQVELRHA